MDSKKKLKMTWDYIEELFQGFSMVAAETEDALVAKVARDMANEADWVGSAVCDATDYSLEVEQVTTRLFDTCDTALRLTVPSYKVVGEDVQHFPLRIIAETCAIDQENCGHTNVKVEETRIQVCDAMKLWDKEKNLDLRRVWRI